MIVTITTEITTITGTIITEDTNYLRLPHYYSPPIVSGGFFLYLGHESTPMKLLLFILCNLCCGVVMAQDCKQHALMQKGTQLEYIEHVYRNVTSFNKDSGYFPLLRLVFTVDQVTDSAGSSWCTIIKKGIGIKDTNDHYERKIVLQCDGKNLRLPYTFYESDTVYTRDHFPPGLKLQEHGWAWGHTTIDNVITYVVPLVMNGVVALPEGTKQFETISIRGISPVFVCINEYKREYNIKSIALERKVKVKTPAGTFKCYKFLVNGEYMLAHVRGAYPVNYWLYLNEKVGLVKLEHESYYTELINIRK